MILHKDRVDHAGGFTVQRESAFGIAPDMMGHVMRILSNMYSDPVLAVAREYITNAVDAHRLARMRTPGVVLPPIEVTTPTGFEPTFKVRDYGPGMSEDETSTLLSNFGASGVEKRQSDSYAGGFGIGSKCAFAISDTYSFTVFNGGRKRVWICTIKPDAEKALQLLVNVPSTEPSGVEVSVPVKSDHVHQVSYRVEKVRAALPETLNIDGNVTQPVVWDTLALCEGVNLVSTNCSGQSSVQYAASSDIVVGDFVFPIGTALQGEAIGFRERLFRLATVQKEQMTFTESTPVLRALSCDSAMLRFPAGTFHPAPNREAIIWGEADKVKLVEAVRELLARVDAEVETLSNSAESTLEYLRIARKLVKIGMLKPIGYGDNVVFRGAPIKIEDLPSIPTGGSSEDEAEVSVVLVGHRRNRRGKAATRIYNLRELRAAREYARTDPCFTLDHVSEFVSGDTYIGYYAEGMVTAFYTTRRYDILQAEKMPKAQLTHQVRTWEGQLRSSSEKLKYMYLLVIGTPEQRAKTIKDLEWCTKTVNPEVFTAPPKAKREARGPGGSSERYVSQYWRVYNCNGNASTYTPQPDDVVVNLGGVVAQVYAKCAHWFIQTMQPYIAELEGARLCSITKDQLKQHTRQGGCKVLDWGSSFKGWFNQWACADTKIEGLGLEIIALHTRLQKPWMLLDDNKWYLDRIAGGELISLNAGQFFTFLRRCEGFKDPMGVSPIDKLLNYALRRGVGTAYDMIPHDRDQADVVTGLVAWMLPKSDGPILTEKSRRTLKKNAEVVQTMMAKVIMNDIAAACLINEHPENGGTRPTEQFITELRKRK